MRFPERAFGLLASITAVAVGITFGIGGVRADAAELKVVVTSKPIHALVASVMSGRAAPKLLVDGNQSPHTYAMKPSDAKAVNEARIFFRVSEGLEPFTGKLVKALPDKVKIVSLAEAPGLELLDRRKGGPFESHAHAPSAKKHGHGHDHAHDDDHEDAAAGHDPHVWLDPDNARAMAKHVATVLSAADPEGAATYAANAAKLDAEIAAVDQDLIRDLAAVKDRPFVVFHDATQYFERHYGLAAAGSITVSPEVQPSAKRLKAIRAKIGELKAGCVFAEPQFKSKVVDTVVEGTGARTGTLDPEGGLLPSGPGHYAALMRGLAASLRDCLAKSS